MEKRRSLKRRPLPKLNTESFINVRSFITALIIIFALMVFTYVLTFFIPGGEFARIEDAGGNLIINTDVGYRSVEGGISFWRWLLSPILVLGSSDSVTLIAVIVFLLVIGGIFSALNSCGLMRYMLKRIVQRFGDSRYTLMAVVVLFFMAMGSFIGSFEECVPLVPIVTAMAVSLGWDALTGLSMILLAAGSGFAAGVFNPFTVGVAQTLAGLPMFSGVGLRALSFVLIYALLLTFIRHHAKKVDRGVDTVELLRDFQREKSMDRGLTVFASILGAGILIVLSSSVITAIQDYTLIIVAVMFLVAGIIAARTAGMSRSELWRMFLSGVKDISPAVIMILMASSVKYTLVESKILDTLLLYAVSLVSVVPKTVVILIIYLVVLVMNFFVASGSAKAFLLIPLIMPIAQLFGVSPQLCIVAYAFGDGFSNVFYPTNPVLLISLGLTDTSYGEWAGWTWKFQLTNILLTSGILMLGLAIGY